MVTIQTAAAYTSGYALWTFSGAVGSNISLDANVSAGDWLVSVNTSSLATDDLILLADNTANYATQSTRYQGQVVPISAIISGSQLRLKDSASTDYTSTPLLKKITAIEDCFVKGLKFKNTFSTTLTGFLRLIYARNIFIECSGEGSGGAGIHLGNCYNFQINHRAKDYYDFNVTSLSQYGYAVSIALGTAHGQVNILAEATCGAFVAGGEDGQHGEPQDIVVTGAATGCVTQTWDCHANTRNISFVGCKTHGARGYAYNLRGTQLSILGGKVADSLGGVALFEVGTKSVIKDVIFRNMSRNEAMGFTNVNSGFGIRASIAVTGLEVTNCLFENMDCSAIETQGSLTDFVFRGNTIRNFGIAGVGGAKHSVAVVGGSSVLTRSKIENNTFEDNGGTSYGAIRLDADASDADLVNNNFSGCAIFVPGANYHKIRMWGNRISGSLGDPIISETYASSLTIDTSLGLNHQITLTGDISTLTLSNPSPGQMLRLILIQDVSAGHSVSWPGTVKFAGTAPTLSGSSKRDILTFQYDGTNWYEVARAINL